jgi:hypothetical protein
VKCGFKDCWSLRRPNTMWSSLRLTAPRIARGWRCLASAISLKRDNHLASGPSAPSVASQTSNLAIEMPRNTCGNHRFKPRFGFGEIHATTDPLDTNLCATPRRRKIVSAGSSPGRGLAKASDKIRTRLFTELLFARLLRCSPISASTMRLLPAAILKRPNSRKNILEVALLHFQRSAPLLNSSK